MFLVIVFIVALFTIVFPKSLIGFWINLFSWPLRFSGEKNEKFRYVFIMFGGMLFFMCVYLFYQKLINIDEVGIFILMAISIFLMFFSRYFSQSLIEYFKRTLNLYEKHEATLVLFTRIIGIICAVIITYFKLKHG